MKGIPKEELFALVGDGVVYQDQINRIMDRYGDEWFCEQGYPNSWELTVENKERPNALAAVRFITKEE